jgi:predicted AlkP superfamily pyrophosphatase or phosphodiesterase
MVGPKSTPVPLESRSRGPRARTSRWLVALFVVAALVAVPIASQTDSPLPVPSAAAAAQDDPTRHAVVISVDGLRPAVLRNLGRAQTPAYHRMMRQGAATLNARTVVEITRTLPNHTSMVTGRPITAGGGHRVTFNDDNGRTVHVAARARYVSSIFDVAHDRGRSTVLLASKDKFRFLERSWNGRNGAPDRVGRNNGRDKIDVFRKDSQSSLTTKLVRRLRNNPPDLAFLHMAGPDVAGHRSGFFSPAYHRAVKATDAQLKRILRTISKRPKLRRTTTVLLTSDHGGQGREHGDPAKRVNYTVPFLAWGAGVDKGADLYRLNRGDRRNPGPRRPGYARTQPIRNADIGNLALDLLDLPPVPGSRINADQSLDVR